MLAAGVELSDLAGSAFPFVGGVSIVAVLTLVFKVTMALTKRGDVRDEAQWKRLEGEIQRKDAEIARLNGQASEWYQLWQHERALRVAAGIDDEGTGP